MSLKIRWQNMRLTMERCIKVKAVAKLVGLCVASYLMFQAINASVYLNLTESLPIGVYVRVPNFKLSRGDYVVYEPSEEIKKLIRENGWGDGKAKFLKQVSGISGDEYEVDEKHRIFLINGKFAGQVFRTDSAGHKLPQLEGKFKVGEDEILPCGTNLRSFDGRYTGAIKVSEVEAKVVPIILWEDKNFEKW